MRVAEFTMRWSIEAANFGGGSTWLWALLGLGHCRVCRSWLRVRLVSLVVDYAVRWSVGVIR
jgi:hypothetical protein